MEGGPKGGDPNNEAGPQNAVPDPERMEDLKSADHGSRSKSKKKSHKTRKANSEEEEEYDFSNDSEQDEEGDDDEEEEEEMAGGKDEYVVMLFFPMCSATASLLAMRQRTRRMPGRIIRAAKERRWDMTFIITRSITTTIGTGPLSTSSLSLKISN